MSKKISIEYAIRLRKQTVVAIRHKLYFFKPVTDLLYLYKNLLFVQHPYN